MSQKWTHSLVSCSGCFAYSVGNFYVRRGREVSVYDRKLADDLKRVKQLSVKDIFEDVPEDTPQKTKKGK